MEDTKEKQKEALITDLIRDFSGDIEFMRKINKITFGFISGVNGKRDNN